MRAIGGRKVFLTLMGLVAILLLGAMCAYGGLPIEALDTLSWAVVFTVAGGVGGNAAEHFAQRPQRAQVVNHVAAQPASPTTNVVVT